MDETSCVASNDTCDVLEMQDGDHEASSKSEPDFDNSDKIKLCNIELRKDVANNFHVFFEKNKNFNNSSDALQFLLEIAESGNRSTSPPQNHSTNNHKHVFLPELSNSSEKEKTADYKRREKNCNSGNFADNVEEVEHFEKIVDAFLFYKIHSLDKLKRELWSYKRLPKHHQQLIPRYLNHMTKIRHCILTNYQLLKLVVRNVTNIFENQQIPNNRNEIDGKKCRFWPASEFNMEKLQSTLRQFVRDWSVDGSAERQICYGTVIDDILRLWPTNRQNVRILVPGAGLGRLAYEIANLGYTCEGNEFSLFVLFCSNFILNRCKSANCFTLYPWIHQWSNNVSYDDQIRPVSIPDVNPFSSQLTADNFSMSAGDFMQIYSSVDSQNSWDCVATVFFIDTARNVLAYVERIFEILKPGGYWINLGPLLYHFAGSNLADDSCIQLPYSELKEACKKIGFEFVDEVLGLKTGYTENLKSLLKYEYECVKFVCLKPKSFDVQTDMLEDAKNESMITSVV